MATTPAQSLISLLEYIAGQMQTETIRPAAYPALVCALRRDLYGESPKALRRTRDHARTLPKAETLTAFWRLINAARWEARWPDTSLNFARMQRKFNLLQRVCTRTMPRQAAQAREQESKQPLLRLIDPAA